MDDQLAALSEALAQTVERAAPATVAVHGRSRLGSSGVVWAPGVIVTAEHTLARDEDITVTLGDGRTLPAELAGRDAGSDLAVLRCDAAASPQPLRTAAAMPAAGSLILAVGRATDGQTAATMGIVSVSGGPWNTWRGGKLDHLLRLDIRLYPTCSGGAVITADGSLAGIATVALTRTLPAAVPVRTIERSVRELLETGRIRRGYLGVGVQPVTLSDGQAGLIVLSVEPGSAAAQAGVIIGDVLIEVGGSSIREPGELQAVLAGLAPGTAADARLIRGGSPVSLQVTVGQRP
jgi:S1-C subfamily serine protease